MGSRGEGAAGPEAGRWAQLGLCIAMVQVLGWREVGEGRLVEPGPPGAWVIPSEGRDGGGRPRVRAGPSFSPLGLGPVCLGGACVSVRVGHGISNGRGRNSSSCSQRLAWDLEGRVSPARGDLGQDRPRAGLLCATALAFLPVLPVPRQVMTWRASGR